MNVKIAWLNEENKTKNEFMLMEIVYTQEKKLRYIEERLVLSFCNDLGKLNMVELQ